LNFYYSRHFFSTFDNHYDRPMYPSKSFLICILFGLLFTRGRSFAQAPVIPAGRLSGLLREYRDHVLNDTAYLKAVDSIAPMLGNDDSLPQRLAVYREIAFGDNIKGSWKARYYSYMALYYANKSQFGSAVYYSEKNNEERVKLGLFEKGGLAHSDLFAISIYSSNRDYPRVIARYDSLRTELLRVPAAVAAGTVSPENVSVALMILNAVGYAASKAKDSARAAEVVRTGENIQAAVRGAPTYRANGRESDYFCHFMGFERERFLHHFDVAGELLQSAIREVTARDFPATLQPSYTEFTYTEAVDFYFDWDKTDSARRYLDVVRALNDSGVQYSTLDPAFLPESNSRLLASTGHFEEAYHELRKVYRLRDSAFYAVSSDKDNNLYALAAGENTRAELLRTEAGRRKAEQSSLYLFTLLSLLIVGGFAGFRIYRFRQRQNLLDLQLHLARNFHDEIGPMLLFANALVKKEMETNPTTGLAELKVQTGQIMEAVRGISHDLKSSRLSTVDSFSREITVLLEKIKRTTGIDFNLRLNNGHHVLSHWQYSHLTKMVNEMIGNSIRHAGCSRITVLIKAMERNLRITYSDNGRGMEPGSVSTGIGIRNIRERTDLLKGSFELENAWPEGYSIELTIPFV
jgi:signal transduction histidine kinase